MLENKKFFNPLLEDEQLRKELLKSIDTEELKEELVNRGEIPVENDTASEEIEE